MNLQGLEQVGMDASLTMRRAKGTDPSRFRGIAVENAVLPKRYLAVVALVLGLLAVVAPISLQPSAAAQLSMTWPTVGRVTQPFGCTGYKAEPRHGNCAHFHGGIDIANKRGTPIRAAAAGTIAYVGREPWYHGPDRAWVVVINHGNGVKTIYVHLQVRDVPGVKKGKHVDKGQFIGYMGMTGRATGPHLHFGLKVNGVWVDPARYCPGSSPPLK
jgi:murein DD-endopeptidase MepM/ murein hydrolase activator NlpD